ncbi:MAG: MarR family winged helix-turn-helix transcriptional regulator [Roseburia sp.]
MEEQFALLVNLLWGECVRNLDKTLEKAEQSKFTNNDYYYLYVIESLGEPNFSAIAEALNLTKPGVTAIVRKLCNMGLVEKHQSKVDKRVYFVSVTQKGKDILNGDREVYRGVTEAIASFCKTKEEQQFIENVLQMLVEKLKKEKEEEL